MKHMVYKGRKGWKGVEMVIKRVEEDFPPFVCFYAPFVADVFENILRGKTLLLLIILNILNFINLKKGETFGLDWAKTRNFINFFRKNPLIVENVHKIRPNRASMERFASKWIILRGKGAQGYAYAQKVWLPSKVLL